MSITVVQTCEMCGKKRDLPMASRQSRTPQPDSGGWRLLNSGSREATLCQNCVLAVVEHALTRASARRDGHPGEINQRALVLQFSERRD